jgi:Fe-S-cluster containining protein
MYEPPPWKTPDDIVELAERTDGQPPLPKGGIPKQKVPGWIRWPIRALFLPFVLLDLACQRVARLFFKTPYKKEGGCNQRGNCCYYIIIPHPGNWFTKLYYFWNTEINGFYPRHPEPLRVDKESVMVMGCRYLQKDGRCGHYRLRPAVCRQWPFIEYFGPPKILKGCGFRAVPRDKNFDPYPQEEQSPKNKLNIIK